MRQVYLEVELRQAFALAREGRKAEAAALAAAFGQPVAGFDFTKDGMKAFVGAPRFQYYCGELQARLGNDAAAREHWRRAAAGTRLPAGGVRVPRGAEARRGERRRVAPAARDGARRGRHLLFRGGHYPAVATCARGMLLRALGRVPEGDEALRQVFVLPDKGMPHHIARLALQEP